MFGDKKVKLIWAESINGAIGKDNELPWYLPEDLAHFKKLTLGQPVLMGWNTWLSLPQKFRPLPGRDNVVLTRNPNKASEATGAKLAASLEEGIQMVSGDTIWVIGGASIYSQAMQYADEVHVTCIDMLVQQGDAWAPDLYYFTKVEQGPWLQSKNNGLCYRFDIYQPE